MCVCVCVEGGGGSVLGIEIVCVRPSKGLDPIYDIKTLSGVSKKNTCARSGKM